MCKQDYSKMTDREILIGMRTDFHTSRIAIDHTIESLEKRMSLYENMHIKDRHIIGELKTLFNRADLAHIVELKTQAELLMQSNTALQTQIKNMPEEMEKKFGRRITDLENRITACQNASPARMRETIKNFFNGNRPKIAWYQIIIICVAMLGGLGGGGFFVRDAIIAINVRNNDFDKISNRLDQLEKMEQGKGNIK